WVVRLLKRRLRRGFRNEFEGCCEFQPAMSAGDALGTSRLFPAVCISVRRISLPRRKCPFEFRPQEQASRPIGFPRELSHTTDGHGLLQQTTAFARRTCKP